MSLAEAVTIAVLALAVVLLAAVPFVIAGGAWAWSRALSAVYNAQSHGISVREQAATVEAVHEAVDDLKARSARAEYVPATDEELEAAILEERRRAEEQSEYDTLSNEGIEAGPPIMEGGMYRGG